MLKKILLAVVFISFLLGGFCFAQGCFAQGRTLEIDYPQLGIQDVQQPTTTKAFLPAYIEYIFTWAIIIAGLLAFFALVYGGILYMTSGGNPSKMSDAREQIIAGFLGLIILLSSFLILNTIDPQLVILEQVKFEPAVSGIKIYSMDDQPGCLESEDEPSLLISSSIPKLKRMLDWGGLNWGFDGDYKIEWIKFLTEPKDLTVYFYKEEEWTGNSDCFGDDCKCPPNTNCYSYTKGCKNFPGTQPKSVKLDYHLPGVYLCANDDCNVQDCKIYNNSSATLPEFDDKTKSIKFVYGEEAKYAAILHEHENFMGEAVLAYIDDSEENKCIKLNELEKLNDKSGKGVNLDGIIKGVSSITVFLKPIGDPIGDGVAFYEDKNHEGCRLPENPENPEDEKEFYQNDAVSDLDEDEYKLCGNYDWNTNICGAGKTCEDKFSSIEMRGNYIALLFEHSNYKGDCEVFIKRDSYFRDNRIGQCGFLGRKDCLTSFIIKARK